MSSNSFKPIERDAPVTNTEQSISNTLRYCHDQSNQSANDEISVSTLLEPITRCSALFVRDTNAALGYDDDNHAFANQVSFKDLEEFLVEIKERFICASKKQKTLII